MWYPGDHDTWIGSNDAATATDDTRNSDNIGSCKDVDIDGW